MTATFKKLSQGFTLIELLVVIAILGILATSLVATIDPLEQIKKSNDANVKNLAVEFLNASLRTYTSEGSMPWYAASYTDCKTQTAAGGAFSGKQLSALADNCVKNLIDAGELQKEFTTATSVTGKVYVSGTSKSATACYSPESKKEKMLAKETSTGDAYSPATSCGKADSVDGTCYRCIKI